MTTSDYKDASVRLNRFTDWAKKERLSRPGRLYGEYMRNLLKLHETMSKIAVWKLINNL